MADRSPIASMGIPAVFIVCSTPPMSGRLSPAIGRWRLALTRTAASCVAAASSAALATITASSSFTFCTSKLFGTMPRATKLIM